MAYHSRQAYFTVLFVSKNKNKLCCILFCLLTNMCGKDAKHITFFYCSHFLLFFTKIIIGKMTHFQRAQQLVQSFKTNDVCIPKMGDNAVGKVNFSHVFQKARQEVQKTKRTDIRGGIITFTSLTRSLLWWRCGVGFLYACLQCKWKQKWEEKQELHTLTRQLNAS